MRNKEERLGANPRLQDAFVPQNVEAPDIDDKRTDFINQINFINPTDHVELPSKGLFYPKNHPLYNEETVEIKQMTAKEEDILSSRNLLKKGVALDKLIQSLMIDRNINPDTLTLSDRNAIIVQARISGYGPEYATLITCPSCAEKSKYTFDLNEKIEREKDTSFAVEPDENGLLVFELPVTKWRIICRALNGNDEKTLLRVSEMKKKNNSANDSILFEQLKLMVVSVQGVSDRDVVEKALNALPAKDSRHLRKVYEQSIPDVDLTRNFKCKTCDYEADLEVPLTADFFWFK